MEDIYKWCKICEKYLLKTGPHFHTRDQYQKVYAMKQMLGGGSPFYSYSESNDFGIREYIKKHPEARQKLSPENEELD